MPTFVLTTSSPNEVIVRLADGNVMTVTPQVGGGGGGITQLTGNVVAGPGSGSQVATVNEATGNVGGVFPITSPLSLGVQPAQSGRIRMPNDSRITARAAANDHDILALWVTNVNSIEINTDGSGSEVAIDAGIGAPITLGPNLCASLDLVRPGIPTRVGGWLEVHDGGTSIASFGAVRWPEGQGSGTGGTSFGIYARNPTNSGDIEVLTVDAIGGVSMGADGSILGDFAIDCAATVSIGENAAHSVNIDASTGTKDISIGTGNAQSVTIGNATMAGGVTMPVLGGGGAQLVSVDNTGLLGTHAITSGNVETLFSLTGNPAVGVVNSNVETDLFSYVLPGGQLPADGELRIRMLGQIFNNVGGNTTFRLYFGGAQVLAWVVSNGPSAVNTVAEILEASIVAAGATNAQYMTGLLSSNNGNTAGSFAAIATGNTVMSDNTAAVDTTVNQTIRLTVQNGSMSPAFSFSMFSAKVVQF
jgi:hypothetical protein